jgi:hypothetical protein
MGPDQPRNPYEAPREAPAAAAPAGELSPNLEDAIAGRYQFTIGEVMSEAWQLIKGMKWTFWSAALVIGIIWVVLNQMVTLAVGMVLTGTAKTVVQQIVGGIIGIVMAPLSVGIQMMCVRRALGLPIEFGTAFSYLHRGAAIIVASLLVILLGYLGLALLIIPGVYLFIAYSLTAQLIADQGLGVWQAMETSRKAITRRWWGVAGLLLVVGLLTMLSAIALLIPLIWTIPWSMMATGVLYRRIFYANAR